MDSRRRWLEKEYEHTQMLKQKARIKWDIEGDENTRYFHSIIKRRHNQNNIRGLMVNGE